MMLVAFFVFVLISTVSGQCSYNKGDLSVNWNVNGGVLNVNFMNKNITNNQWTGMGWGPAMTSLEVVVFQVVNNSPSVIKGYTTGYAPPMTNPNSAVNVKSLTFAGNTLTASFSRPLAANGANTKDISQCMSWKFVPGGDVINGQLQIHHRGKDGMDVCPMQCTSMING